MTRRLQTELRMALALVAAGLFVLPAAIYVVGQRIVGEYAPDAGVMHLAEQIWLDLLRGRPAAWILVLSPYLLVQLVRLARRIRRAGVKHITVSQHGD